MQCTLLVIEFRIGPRVNLNKFFRCASGPRYPHLWIIQTSYFLQYAMALTWCTRWCFLFVEIRAQGNWRKLVHTLILSYYGVKPRSRVAHLDPENWDMYQAADIRKCIPRNSWILSIENCILNLEHKFCNYLFSTTRLSSNSYAP